MNCEEIKMNISDYIDDELPKEKEAFLFTHLAICSGCREEFKIQNSIHHEVDIHCKEVSELFENRLYNSIRNSNKNIIHKIFSKQSTAYLSFAFGVILIFLTIFSFYQMNELRKEVTTFRVRYENSLEQINYQARQLYLIMNSMPAVEIEPKNVQIIN